MNFLLLLGYFQQPLQIFIPFGEWTVPFTFCLSTVGNITQSNNGRTRLTEKTKKKKK